MVAARARGVAGAVVAHAQGVAGAEVATAVVVARGVVAVIVAAFVVVAHGAAGTGVVGKEFGDAEREGMPCCKEGELAARKQEA